MIIILKFQKQNRSISYHNIFQWMFLIYLDNFAQILALISTKHKFGLFSQVKEFRNN